MENTVAGLGIVTSGPLKGRPVLSTWSLGKNAAMQGTTPVHTYVTISTDLAGTGWGALTDAAAITNGSNYSASPIVQVDDTNFQQAVYVYAGGSGSARTVGLTYDGSKFVIGSVATIAAVTSASSTNAANVVSAPGNFTEVGMVKLRDGRLLSLVRNDTGTSSGIWQSFSSDGGKTWTKAMMSFAGSGAPRVTLTSDGKVVVLYRMRNGVTAANANLAGQLDAVYRVSSNNGASWGPETKVGTHAPFEMAYGTPVANSDGSITFVYANETTGALSNLVTTANVAVK